MKNIIILFLCLLASCATTDHAPIAMRPSSLSWTEQQAKLQKLLHWQVNGLMSLHRDDQSASFSFQWLQQRDRYDLLLFAPLGLASVHILGDAHHVTLWKSATSAITARNPEGLMRSQLGYSVPLSSLYYWIRGMPAPHLPSKETVDTSGHLLQLVQQGWIIHYASFQSVAGFNLPMHIALENAAARVKIVITNWEIL